MSRRPRNCCCRSAALSQPSSCSGGWLGGTLGATGANIASAIIVALIATLVVIAATTVFVVALTCLSLLLARKDLVVLGHLRHRV